MKILKRLIPFIVSAFLMFIIVGLAPWSEVWRILSGLQIATIAILVTLSLSYYLAKAYRFWYMLQIINIKEPLWPVVLVYLSAQPITLLPGGELYRTKALQRYRGVRMSRSVATFTTQGIFEGLGLAAVGLTAAIMLGIGELLAFLLLAVVTVAILGIRRGYLEPISRWINKLPFFNISRQRLKSFSERNQAMFRGTDFIRLAALSLSVELIGVLIALVSVNGLGGDINLLQAALVYIVPVIVAFVSFLPGGFGASEQSAIGLLILMGQGGGLAVAATILLRAFVVGSGLVYSAVAWGLIRLIPNARKLDYSRGA